MNTRIRLRSGFTMIELSIVIMLLAILFTVMFGVFFGTSRIASTQSPRSREQSDAMLALEILRSTISQTYFHPDIDRLVFYGKEDRITFAAVHPVSGTASSVVREVSFYLKDSAQPDMREKTYVLMKREDEPVDKKPGEGGFHYQILDKVEFVKFKYSLNGREWSEKWNSKQSRRIPRLIQIQLGAKIGGKTRILETLASPGLYIN